MTGRYVGRGMERVDALAKVTGRTKFSSDLKMPGMCHGRILYSAHPRARVIRINKESALSLPGVEKGDYRR